MMKNSSIRGFLDVVKFIGDREFNGELCGLYEITLPTYLARALIREESGELYVVEGSVTYFCPGAIDWVPVEDETPELRKCILLMVLGYESNN